MNAGRHLIAALGLVLASVGNAAAGPDAGPVIVVPGRPGVPVMVNGQDVSGAVIEGDWGLGRPYRGVVIFWPNSLVDPKSPGYPGRSFAPQAPRGFLPGGFFPATGRQPRMGREEVIPPADRPLPPKAESFQRSWRSESPNLPADIEQPRYLLPLVGVDVDWPSRRHGPRRTPESQAPDR